MEDNILVLFNRNGREICTFVIGVEDLIEISLEEDNCVRIWSSERGTCVPIMIRINCERVTFYQSYTREEVNKLHGIEEKLVVLEMENNETIEFSTTLA